MTAEQTAVWMHTYQQALSVLLPRSGDLNAAITQAAACADHALTLYPGEQKRGPGRPPKEKHE